VGIVVCGAAIGKRAEIGPGETGVKFSGRDTVAVYYGEFETTAVEVEVFFGGRSPFVGAGPVVGVVERELWKETCIWGVISEISRRDKKLGHVPLLSGPVARVRWGSVARKFRIRKAVRWGNENEYILQISFAQAIEI